MPVMVQTVLLLVASNVFMTFAWYAHLKELNHKLLMMRVRPYYIYQCDLSQGISHFRTPVEKGLEIPPGGTVTLAPGGFHLMMMGLKGPLKQGTNVPVTLVFEKAGKIDVQLSVAGLGATQPSQ